MTRGRELRRILSLLSKGKSMPIEFSAVQSPLIEIRRGAGVALLLTL